MKRDSKRKINYLVVSIFVLVIFATTVAYAAVTQRLTVSGEVNRKGGTWNIYMSNPVLYQKTGSAGSSELELVDSTTLHVSAYLTEPGDSIVYTFRGEITKRVDFKYSFCDSKTISEIKLINSVLLPLLVFWIAEM